MEDLTDELVQLCGLRENDGTLYGHLQRRILHLCGVKTTMYVWCCSPDKVDEHRKKIENNLVISDNRIASLSDRPFTAHMSAFRFRPQGPNDPTNDQVRKNLALKHNKFLIETECIGYKGLKASAVDETFEMIIDGKPVTQTLRQYVFTTTTSNGQPLFHSIHRTSKTGKHLFLCSKDDAAEARVFLEGMAPSMRPILSGHDHARLFTTSAGLSYPPAEISEQSLQNSQRLIAIALGNPQSSESASPEDLSAYRNVPRENAWGKGRPNLGRTKKNQQPRPTADTTEASEVRAEQERTQQQNVAAQNALGQQQSEQSKALTEVNRKVTEALATSNQTRTSMEAKHAESTASLIKTNRDFLQMNENMKKDINALAKTVDMIKKSFDSLEKSQEFMTIQLKKIAEQQAPAPSFGVDDSMHSTNSDLNLTQEGPITEYATDKDDELQQIENTQASEMTIEEAEQNKRLAIPGSPDKAGKLYHSCF